MSSPLPDDCFSASPWPDIPESNADARNSNSNSNEAADDGDDLNFSGNLNLFGEFEDMFEQDFQSNNDVDHQQQQQQQHDNNASRRSARARRTPLEGVEVERQRVQRELALARARTARSGQSYSLQQQVPVILAAPMESKHNDSDTSDSESDDILSTSARQQSKQDRVSATTDTTVSEQPSVRRLPQRARRTPLEGVEVEQNRIKQELALAQQRAVGSRARPSSASNKDSDVSAAPNPKSITKKANTKISDGHYSRKAPPLETANPPIRDAIQTTNANVQGPATERPKRQRRTPLEGADAVEARVKQELALAQQRIGSRRSNKPKSAGTSVVSEESSKMIHNSHQERDSNRSRSCSKSGKPCATDSECTDDDHVTCSETATGRPQRARRTPLEGAEAEEARVKREIALAEERRLAAAARPSAKCSSSNAVQASAKKGNNNGYKTNLTEESSGKTLTRKVVVCVSQTTASAGPKHPRHTPKEVETADTRAQQMIAPASQRKNPKDSRQSKKRRASDDVEACVRDGSRVGESDASCGRTKRARRTPLEGAEAEEARVKREIALAEQRKVKAGSVRQSTNRGTSKGAKKRVSKDSNVCPSSKHDSPVVRKKSKTKDRLSGVQISAKDSVSDQPKRARRNPLEGADAERARVKKKLAIAGNKKRRPTGNVWKKYYSDESDTDSEAEKAKKARIRKQQKKAFKLRMNDILPQSAYNGASSGKSKKWFKKDSDMDLLSSSKKERKTPGARLTLETNHRLSANQAAHGHSSPFNRRMLEDDQQRHEHASTRIDHAAASVTNAPHHNSGIEPSSWYDSFIPDCVSAPSDPRATATREAGEPVRRFTNVSIVPHHSTLLNRHSSCRKQLDNKPRIDPETKLQRMARDFYASDSEDIVSLAVRLQANNMDNEKDIERLFSELKNI